MLPENWPKKKKNHIVLSTFFSCLHYYFFILNRQQWILSEHSSDAYIVLPSRYNIDRFPFISLLFFYLHPYIFLSVPITQTVRAWEKSFFRFFFILAYIFFLQFFDTFSVYAFPVTRVSVFSFFSRFLVPYATILIIRIHNADPLFEFETV